MKNITKETLQKVQQRENQRSYKQKVARVKNFNQVTVQVCKPYEPRSKSAIKVKDKSPKRIF